MIVQLDHIQLAMPENEEYRARVFYGDVLGLAELEKPSSLQGRGGVWYQITNDRQIHLGVEKPFSPNRKAHPCFVTDALDRLAETLQAEGYPVTWDDALSPVRRFYTADCFANRLEFVDRPTSI